MGIRRHFTDHPAAVGETYLEHMRHAAGFARTMAKATVACTIHAIVPSMCERTASTAICELHERITAGARGDWVAEAFEDCGQAADPTDATPFVAVGN